MNTKKAALIIMHCQNDIVHPDGLYRHAGVYAQVEKNHTLDTIASLAQACRDAGIQVIYINNEFKEGYPELGPNNLPICTSSRDTHLPDRNLGCKKSGCSKAKGSGSCDH